MFLELSKKQDHDNLGIVIRQIKTNSTPCGPSFLDPILSLIIFSFHFWYHNHYSLSRTCNTWPQLDTFILPCVSP